MEKNNEMEELLFSIYEKPTREIDNYIEYIKESILDGNTSNTLLESYVVTLPIHLYWLITECEKLGIQEDYAKLKKGEVYNQALKIATGKVDEKRATAEQESAEQALIHSAYSRAYKLMKGKVEMAQELLNSCKKILTLRVAEAELSNNRFNGRRNNDAIQ